MRYAKHEYLYGNRNVAKRRRLAKLGLTPTKAELLDLCRHAIATVIPTKLPPGKPPETTRGHKYDRSGRILRG
jgi:hypothetical protein